jgi:hypothetical protein
MFELGQVGVDMYYDKNIFKKDYNRIPTNFWARMKWYVYAPLQHKLDMGTSDSE